ncbi:MULTISPECIES: stage III sporulation protein AE [Clostridia]|uniref:Stage III sporulation protein AE n=2 Tax=Clostridia TaxID=186801 RepID=A0A8I0DN96_9CLOT|nr:MULTISPECIES: stage III sporulation protein AE [Clostridia]MBC5640179.1 stage III sporulation protein AE [Clostridium lentum]MBC5654397.1 stage III sporulation protein AE [Blautia lenta]CDB75565.1 sporulation stage III [Clostridium sp. CAG:265]
MKMNKCLKYSSIILLLIGLFFFSYNSQLAYAEDNNYNVISNDEINGDLEGLYDYISTMKSDFELINDLDPVSYIKNYITTGKGNLSFSKICDAVISLLFKEVKTVLSMCITIVVIGIICSLIKNLQSAFSSDSISEIAFYACYALMIIVLTRTFIISLDLAKDIITEISGFMSKLLPILVVMLGVAGGFTESATMDPIVLGTTIIIPKIYLNIILPLILITFVLQFTNNISTEPKISNLCSLVKSAVLWIQGLILTVYIGLLTVRGITASTIDAVTLKTAKFTIDNFIPIVGKTFSDAITSVAGYSLIIKNAIGSVGLIVLILIIIYPIIKIFLSSIILKISSSLLEPIADKRITKAVFSAGDSLVLILSSVLCVSLMFFVLIAMMVSAGKFVIGG